MPAELRIRKFFAAGFVAVCLIGAYLSLAPDPISKIPNLPNLPQYSQSDKALHFVALFAITICFYWIIETSRRRMINLCLLVCMCGIGIGGEILQGLLPNGRIFDPLDIVANISGSGAAILLCAWYHKRMLERKRAKRYQVVPGGEPDDHEIEMVDGTGDEEQEVGVVAARAEPTVTEQLDAWDENAQDWDEDEAATSTQVVETDSAKPVDKAT